MKKKIHLYLVLVWLLFIAVLAGCATMTMHRADMRIQSNNPLIVVNGPPPGGLFRKPRILTQVTNAIQANEEHTMSIQVPSSGPTNLKVRAYYTRVAYNAITGVVSPSNSPVLGTNYFDQAAGHWNGASSVAVNPGGWTNVDFQLNTNGFVSDSRESGHITFVFRGTNGTNVYEAVYVYPVTSPYP